MKPNILFISSLIIPGSGQLILKRFLSGLSGLIIFVLEILTMMEFIIPSTKLIAVKQASGVWTIGATPYEDDSFLILMGFVFAMLLLIIFAMIHIFYAITAKQAAKEIEEYGQVKSFKEKFSSISGELVPNLVTLPAFILLISFTIIPTIISIIVAFTNYRMPILPPAFLLEWRGLDNFKKLITDDRMSALFRDTLSWSLVWTFSVTLLILTLGTVLAVVVNNKLIKGKKFFRTVFILPWAVPSFLTILIFQYFFSKLGAMNSIVLPWLWGKPYEMESAIPFLMNPTLAKITIILIKSWLGFPYTFVLVTGVLQTIPDDLYEASNIDGGNAFTNFFHITLPIILMSVAPMFITQFAYNFNDVMIIYLLSDAVVKPVGAIYGPLETVASLGFKLMMDSKFNEAAVFSLIVSTVVGLVVLFSWLKSGAFKNEEVM